MKLNSNKYKRGKMEFFRKKYLSDEKSKQNLSNCNQTIIISLIIFLKSSINNLLRSIPIILILFVIFELLFSIPGSLKFDKIQKYAEYQNKNNNFVIELNNTYEDGDIKVQSGFNLVDYSEYQALYTGSDKFTAYKSTIFDFPVATEEAPSHNFYAKEIQRVNVYKDKNEFKIIGYYISNYAYQCLITDYVADMLIYYNYFGKESINTYEKVCGQYITHHYFKNRIQIVGVIETPHYREFVQSFNFETGKFRSKDIEVAFKDNLPFYNAIYMTEAEFYSETSTSLLSYSKNVDTVIDNIIYEGLGKKGYAENVTFTDFDKYLSFKGQAPVKPEDGLPIQIAVSRGFLNDLYGSNSYKTSGDNDPVFSSSFLSPGLMNADYNIANFKITGVKRSQAVFNFIVTAVVDTDEHVVYLPSYMYQSYLNSSFNRGGNLIFKINNNTDINADIYRSMYDNHIIINNLSYKNFQITPKFIVDDFINNNSFAITILSICLFLKIFLLYFN